MDLLAQEEVEGEREQDQKRIRKRIKRCEGDAKQVTNGPRNARGREKSQSIRNDALYRKKANKGRGMGSSASAQDEKFRPEEFLK